MSDLLYPSLNLINVIEALRNGSMDGFFGPIDQKMLMACVEDDDGTLEEYETHLALNKDAIREDAYHYYYELLENKWNHYGILKIEKPVLEHGQWLVLTTTTTHTEKCLAALRSGLLWSLSSQAVDYQSTQYHYRQKMRGPIAENSDSYSNMVTICANNDPALKSLIIEITQWRMCAEQIDGIYALP
jgi:hypothetical protein